MLNTMYIINRLFFSFLVLAFACTTYAYAQDDLVFLKQWDDVSHRRMNYLVFKKDKTCSIEWTVGSYNETRHTGIAETSQCKLPIDQQMPFRERLFHEMQKDLNSALPITSFSLGFMSSGFKEDTSVVFSERLVQAVLASKDWDKKRGRLKDRRKRLSFFIVEILNSAKVFQEIKGSFEKFRYRIQVNSVEEIQMDKVGGYAVPVNALVWFSVEKM